MSSSPVSLSQSSSSSSLSRAEGAQADALAVAVGAVQHREKTSKAKKAAKASAKQLLEDIVSESDGQFLKKSLSASERKAVAGALACVVVGLDGNHEAATAFLSVAVTDLLGHDAEHVMTLEPLTHATPETLQDETDRQQMAASSFILNAGGDGEEEEEDAWEQKNKKRRRKERWTKIVGALMIGAVATKAYTAHASAALQRLAAAADIEWDAISALEDVLAAHLKSVLAGGDGAGGAGKKDGKGAKIGKSNSSSSWSVLSRSDSSGGGGEGKSSGGSSIGGTLSRAATVGAAAVVGGGLLFLTGGMAAPAMVASLASLGGVVFKLN